MGRDYLEWKDKMKTKVENNDLWVLLVSCVRYSMGRMTYMSSLAPSLVLRYKNALSADQLTQIADEIKSELKLRKLGADCDHESWIQAERDIREAARQQKEERA